MIIACLENFSKRVGFKQKLTVKRKTRIKKFKQEDEIVVILLIECQLLSL